MPFVPPLMRATVDIVASVVYQFLSTKMAKTFPNFQLQVRQANKMQPFSILRMMLEILRLSIFRAYNKVYIMLKC